MKTIETINTLCKEDAALYRAKRDYLLSNIKTLDSIVRDAIDNGGKVRDAVKEFVKQVGSDAAVQTVASLVNRSAWDGRISTANANWAKAVEDSWDEDAMVRMGAYCKMHMAHLDQTADYLRRDLDTICTELVDELVAENAAEMERVEAEQKSKQEEEQKAKAMDEAVQDEMDEEAEAHRTERALAVLGRVVDRIDYDRKGRRSAWGEGVQRYERELVADLVEAVRDGWVGMDDLEAPKLLERSMLNGASDWRQYSWGGCSLIYDGDIAERLCTPSELKKTRHGERRPNSSEEWLDTQARALYQAAKIVKRYVAVEMSLEVA